MKYGQSIRMFNSFYNIEEGFYYVKYLNGEEILCSIKTSKTIKNSNKVINILANLISNGVAGRITNDFKLILTNENLYIEAIAYCAWGGLPETMYTDKISRKDIKSFEVKSEETNEIIKIITMMIR